MIRISFNRHWLFAPENTLDAMNLFGFDKYADAIGAPARYYDHAGWQVVDLPHDWAAAMPVDLRCNTFAGARPNSHAHRFMTERKTTSDAVASVGWYRKHFTPDPNWMGKRVFIVFEGVFRDAAVWVNGVYLDRHLSGYTSFTLELTDHLVFGEENSVAVRVDSDQPEGWWYEGAGIYRNVFLHIAEPVYVQKPFIRTALDGTADVQFEVINDTPDAFCGTAELTVLAPDGSRAAQAAVPVRAEGYGQTVCRTSVRIPSPLLWHVEHPHLYTLNVRIGQEVHRERFGVRTVAFDPDRGFLLNGQPYKIRGVCVHQDFGGVGVALTDNLQYYKIRRLKEMGANAYRCSHNAPAPALLRACDELGMLVMDETRLFGTSPEALRQLRDVMERDRNHPCVFIWSLGNEEFSVQDDPWSARLMAKMTRIAKAIDPSRPVTYSGNNGSCFAGANGAAEVRGVNYIRNDSGEGGLWLDRYHADHPHQPIIGTEEGSYVLSRGGAQTDLAKKQLDASGLVTMPWGSTPKGWVRYFEERDYLAGSFLWTGFDYRGEPNPFVTANTASSFGTIDLCGMEKPPFHYYRAWWTDEPVLTLAPHWNHQAGETVEVCVFTNCEQVTLRVNGRLLETRAVRRFDAPVFRVPFEPGVLTAEGMRNGQVLHAQLQTAKETAFVSVSRVLEADEDGVAIWELEARDEDGLFCPTADEEVTVCVDGGRLVGIGNGDPAFFGREQFPDVEESLLLTAFTADGVPYPIPPKAPNRLRHRHDWLETEPSGNGFADDERRIAFFADACTPAQTVVLTAAVLGAAGYEYIEFERLGGAARVFLNGEEIGNNIDRANRIPISNVRPYRFACRFREGENELRIVSAQKEFSDPPVSGTVKIGRTVPVQTVRVRLHYGRARVFVKGAAVVTV